MCRHLGVSLLGLSLLLAPAPSAQAAGMIDPSLEMLVNAFVKGVSQLDESVEQNEQQQFAAAFTLAVAGLGGGQLQITLGGNPDPSLDYELTVENLSAQAASIVVSLVMPIVAIGGTSEVQASLDVTLTDGNANGASLTTFLPHIQTSYLSEDGSLFTTMNVGVGGQLVSAPGGSFSAGPQPGPLPNPVEGPVFSQMLLHLNFVLSAGDTATLEGSVQVVPEPARVALAAGAALLAALSRAGGRRRTRPRAGRPRTARPRAA